MIEAIGCCDVAAARRSRSRDTRRAAGRRWRCAGFGLRTAKSGSPRSRRRSWCRAASRLVEAGVVRIGVVRRGPLSHQAEALGGIVVVVDQLFDERLLSISSADMLDSQHHQLVEARSSPRFERDRNATPHLLGLGEIHDPLQVVAHIQPLRRRFARDRRRCPSSSTGAGPSTRESSIVRTNGRPHQRTAADSHQHQAIGHHGRVRRLCPGVGLGVVDRRKDQSRLGGGRRIAPVGRFGLECDPGGAIRRRTVGQRPPRVLASFVGGRGAKRLPIGEAVLALALVSMASCVVTAISSGNTRTQSCRRPSTILETSLDTQRQ